MNSFKELLTRQYATFNPDNELAEYYAEPAVSGYFITVFRIPSAILSKVEEYEPGVANFVESPAKMGYIMAAATKSITIPDSPALNVQPRINLAGANITIPVGLTPNNTMNITFYEFMGFPLLRFIRGWTRVIFDPITGLSVLDKFRQNDYKGTVDLLYFDPSGETLTFGIRCYGVFPNRAPFDGLNADISNNSLIEVTCEFSVDRVSPAPSIEASLVEILRQQVDSVKSMIS